MSKLFVLTLMVFCHIVDDYYLQGVLASMKQKNWWTQNTPGKLYRYDYIVALVMHGFSWTFMVMLPIAALYSLNPPYLFYWCFTLNVAIHAFTDNVKANLRTINLIMDQSVHIEQIILTFLLLT